MMYIHAYQKIQELIYYLNLKRLIISMASLRIRLGQTRNVNSEQKLKQMRNQPYTKKQMQIVSQRIDNNLKKTYSKLKIDGYSQLKNNQSPQIIEESTVKDTNLHCRKIAQENVKHISLKRRNNFSANGQYSTPLVKQSKIRLQKNEIVLIDNKDVMEYIQLIYETYNINDPLKGNPFKNEEVMMSETTIEKNRRDLQYLDEQFSLNSARTVKENSSNIAQISQFDVDQEQKIKKTANKRNNKIIITLRGKSAQKCGWESTKKAKQNPLLVSRQAPNVSLLSKKTTSNKQNQNIHQKIAQNDKIPCYRYCFACERPIFQQHIRKHQGSCIQLKQAYSLSFSQIVSLIDEKIERIINKIDDKIMYLSAQSLTQRFQRLQSLIKDWVMEASRLKGHNYLQNKSRQNLFDRFKRQFQMINYHLDSNFYEDFELLNKLNWFSRLRHNILRKQDLF